MNIGTHEPDNLLAGDFPRVTGWLGIATGTFKRGAVVTVADSTSDRPARYGVLAEDADASSGPVQAPVFLTGEFSRRHMVTSSGSALSDDDVIALSFQSIFVKETVPA